MTKKLNTPPTKTQKKQIPSEKKTYEQTKQLVDTLLHEYPTIGQTTVHISVPNRQTVQNPFFLLSQILKK